MAAEQIKKIAQNKKAYHDYCILETYEAGIELFGTEVKSIREGRINLKAVSYTHLTVEKRTVELGVFSDDDYEVKSGLSEGEMVVICLLYTSRCV